MPNQEMIAFKKEEVNAKVKAIFIVCLTSPITDRLMNLMKQDIDLSLQALRKVVMNL